MGPSFYKKLNDIPQKLTIKEEKIYIVGFPKAGNTWLVRMIAKILSYQVEREPMGGGGVDLAYLVNYESDSTSNGRVLKVHFMPGDFLSKIDAIPQKIVYISRDPKDVFISSFFYFIAPDMQKETLLLSGNSIFKNPLKFIRHLYARRKLTKFLNVFSTEGIPGSGLRTVYEHKHEWEQFLKGNEGIVYVFTTYENLLQDTIGEMRKILIELGFKNISSNRISQVVTEERFDSLQKKAIKFHHLDGSFSREYYTKFFRSGKVGDWKNYLTQSQSKVLDYGRG